MRFFKLLHFTSLDVVFGSLVMQSLIWQMLVGRNQTWPAPVALALSVWIYYLLDRQLDNYHFQPSDDVHRFHLRFQTTIRSFIFFLLVGLVFVVTFLPVEQIYLGGYLSIGMVIYGLVLSYWDRFYLPKELFTSILYASGLFLPTYSAGKFSFLVFASVILLAFLNLTLFSWLEGKPNFRLLFLRLQLPLVVCLLCVGMQYSWFFAACLLIIQVIHVWIYFFNPNLQSRWIGELAFSSPLLYFVYELF
jgi:hypothetical protein